MNRSEDSRRRGFPPRISPMLARKTSEPFKRDGWVFEPKWDGFRGLAAIRDSEVDLYSRHQKSLASTFPDIADALTRVEQDVIFDGEIVVFDASGKINFDLIRQYRQKREGTPGYFIFDLLEQDGENIMPLPWHKRNQLLHDVYSPLPNIRVTPHESDGKVLFDAIKDLGLEGIMAKKANSRYLPNVRSRNWLKIKSYVRRGWKDQDRVYR
jgi:bifunctional non-homologous end joining protein LigD